MDLFEETSHLAHQIDLGRYRSLARANKADGGDVLYFRARILTDFDVKVFASSFLLTHAYLMGTRDRAVLKMVNAVIEGDVPRSAVENSLRALLAGEFSSLRNVEQWITILSQRIDLKPRLIERPRKVAESLNTFDNSRRGLLDEFADTIIVVSNEGMEKTIQSTLGDDKIHIAFDEFTWDFDVANAAQFGADRGAIAPDGGCYFFESEITDADAYVDSWQKFQQL